MKIVLDTNVFISGVFFTGPPYRILEAWRDRTLELVSWDIGSDASRIRETTSRGIGLKVPIVRL